MTRLSRLGRPVAFLIVILTLVGSMVGVFTIRATVEDVRAAQRENLLWGASQLRIEYLRFMGELKDFAAERAGVTPDDVNLRFDVLWSRVAVLRAGSAREYIASTPGAEHALGQMEAVLRDQEQAVVGLTPGDFEKARQILVAFDAMAPEMREFGLVSLRKQGEVETRQYQDLRWGSQLLTLLVAGTALAMLLLIGIYAMDARRQAETMRQTRKLLAAAQEGQRARTQFLSMMSHELRTPMNGILGMIALARQPGMPRAQDQLLAEATQSAKEMHGLLADILDLSAGDPEGTSLQRTSVTELAKRLQGELSERDLVVRADPPDERPFRCDVDSLARALDRLMGHAIVLNGGTPDTIRLQLRERSLAVIIDVPEGALHCDITMSTGEGGFDSSSIDATLSQAFMTVLGAEMTADTDRCVITVPVLI